MSPIATPDRPTIKTPEKPAVPKPIDKPEQPQGPREEIALNIVRVGEARKSPDEAFETVAARIRVDLSEANLARLDRLRKPENVGPQAYDTDTVYVKDKNGRISEKKFGLVNSAHSETYSDPEATQLIHKKAETVAEHEAAQAVAYAGLQEKIDKGLVDPSQIGSEMVRELGVSPDVVDSPKTHAEIPGRVGEELKTFVEQKFITEEEAALIQKEVETFSDIYHKAYPDADAAKAYELVRDNARILAYQTLRDTWVFSGSDHGVNHILRGNMAYANQMIAGLEAQGIQVSAKDNILIRQTIIDHDCGYTCGCAQAKAAYEGSKDHPLNSARFVEANRAYYTDKFGEEEYGIIQRSILNHSYPTEIPQSLGPGEVHENLVRSISSTVDSLGVTAESKTPRFFKNNPDAIHVLLQIQILSETSGLNGSIPKDMMEQYKQALHNIAARETNENVRQGFDTSINDFFSEFTAARTLGHHTGVIDKVGITRNKDGKLVPQIDMSVSQIHALIGNMFGGKLETEAFVKAMEDLGMSNTEIKRFAIILEEARKNGITPTPEDLVFDSPKARFVVNPQLAENARDEFSNIREIMDEAYKVTIRPEINRLLDSLGEGQKVSPGTVSEIGEKFISTISDKTTEAELITLTNLLSDLSAGDSDKMNEARTNLRRFLTTQEKEFLGLPI